MRDLEYNFVKHKVLRLTGVDLNCYKSQQVIRRLGVYLRRSGYPNWPGFFRAIQDDPAELDKLKDYLTINVSTFLRDRYFCTDGDGYYVVDGLRRKVTFAHHNLLADPFAGEFDLIVCRNVVIYFQAEAKARLYRRFHDALRPGGVLFLGGTEVVSKPSSVGFELLNVSFYRRNGSKEHHPGELPGSSSCRSGAVGTSGGTT